MNRSALQCIVRKFRFAAVFVSALLVGAAVLVVPAAGAEDGEAVESGREALQDGGGFVWYDEKSDGVRRIAVTPPDLSQNTPANQGGTSSLFAGGDWFTPLAWIAIAIVLGLLVFLLTRAYLSRERATAQIDDEGELEGDEDQIDRVENLPVRLRRPTSNLLSEARAQYEAGNYREAIIYLYSHQLLQLDRGNLIHLTRGKTNRQYLREVAVREPLRRLLEQTMVTFEDVFFGNRDLNRERFESCWHQQDEFDTLIQQALA